MNELSPVPTEGESADPATEWTENISTAGGNGEIVRFTALKCALFFLSDLVGQLAIPEKVEFKQTASYGSST